MANILSTAFNSFLTNGLKNNYNGIDFLNTRLINIFSAVAFFYMFFMGITVFSQGDILLGLVDLTIAAGYIVTLFIFRFKKNINIAANMVVILLYFLELFLLLFGGREGTGYLWFYTFPLISFILLGHRKGVYFNLLFFITIVIIFYTPIADLSNISF